MSDQHSDKTCSSSSSSSSSSSGTAKQATKRRGKRSERHGYVELVMAVAADDDVTIIDPDKTTSDEMAIVLDAPLEKPDPITQQKPTQKRKIVMEDEDSDDDDDDDDDLVIDGDSDEGSVGSLVDFVVSDDEADGSDSDLTGSSSCDLTDSAVTDDTSDDDDDEDGEDEADPNDKAAQTKTDTDKSTATTTTTIAEQTTEANTRQNGRLTAEDEGLDVANILEGRRRTRRPARRYMDEHYAALMFDDLPPEHVDVLFQDDTDDERPVVKSGASAKKRRSTTTSTLVEDDSDEGESSEDDYKLPDDYVSHRDYKRRARRHFY